MEIAGTFTSNLPTWLPGGDILLVLAIVVGSIILFVSDKLPIDGVAFLVLLVLLLTGVVPEEHILDGFSSPATMTIAAMFVISSGLQRTGFVRLVANHLRELAGKGRTRLTWVLMTACGVLSAFVNNTATVAVLLPVTLGLCRDRNINAGKILMPLSFAAQFGGVCTLIGTTTNLLVNIAAVEAGLPPFGMFEFAQLGLVCFVVGTLYMLVVATFIPGRAEVENPSAEYRLQDYLTELRVMEASPLIGQTGEANDLMELGEMRILEIIRDGKMIWAPQTTEIRENDLLLVRGPADRVMGAIGHLKLEDWAEGNLSEAHLKSDETGLMEVIIPASSHLIGRTLSQLDFYWRYRAAVLGVRRRGAVLRERIAKVQFEANDTLLLQGHKDDLQHLADEGDFVFFQDLSALHLKKRRAMMAVAILVGVVLATMSGVVSLLTAALAGALAIVATRCLGLQEAYEAIDMRVVLLLAGLIPLGIAMENSGAALWMVEGTMALLGNHDPKLLLMAFYIATAVLTSIMSNSATAVLMAPIAIGAAASLNVDPKPFLMAITFAASTCFTTPVGYQTNAMVYGPGGYRYLDFLVVGLPLNILFFAISVVLIPRLWPF